MAKDVPHVLSSTPKKAIYCLLAVLVILNMIYRYPLDTTHETGADTTFIHTLAGSLIEEGYAKWVLNPTSLFGLFALSYPSGVPFILAEFSELSGVSIEGTILILGMALGVIGALGTFLVARELFRNDLFAFVAGVLLSLAPFFLKDTTWVGSARGSVVALVPIILWLLIRSTKRTDSRYFILSVLVFVMACSLHRMGFLIVFFFISYFFISSIHKITQKIRFAFANYERLFRAFGTVAALSGFFLLFYVQILFPGYGGFNIVEVYGRGTFFEGTDFLTMLLNMGVNFIGKVGIVIPLAILGLVLYVWKRPKAIEDKFVLVVILLLVPFLSLRDYISEFLILFFVLVFVFILVYAETRRIRWRRGLKVATILVLAVSLSFSWVMKDYWRDKYASDAQISEATFDTAVYSSVRCEGTLLSNFGLTAGGISAVSNGPVLPLGGASTHWRSPQQLIFGTSKSSNLLFFPLSDLQTRRLNYDEVTFTTDEVFVPTNTPNAQFHWETILAHSLDNEEATSVAEKYEIRYIVITKTYPYYYMSYGRRNSVFLQQIQLGPNEARYKVFENTEESLWFYR